MEAIDAQKRVGQNYRKQLPSCEDAEAEERFRKFLDIMAEIDLQRLSELIQQTAHQRQ